MTSESRKWLAHACTASRGLPARSLRRRGWTIGVLACGLLAIGGGASAQEQPVAAVYKMHEVDFTYRSRLNLRPCHELQASVANILRGIGARDDVQVRADGCDEFSLSQGSSMHDPTFEDWDRDRFDRPGDAWGSSRDRLHDRHREQREQSSLVRVRLMMPVEVTPEVREEMDRDKSRRELISRVTRNPVAALNDPTVFPAQRQQVTLSRRTMRLDPQDCDVLEQMRGVFRELDVRVVGGSLNCRSRITPELTVEALVPVGVAAPTPGGAGGAAPSAPPSQPTTTASESSGAAGDTTK